MLICNLFDHKNTPQIPEKPLMGVCSVTLLYTKYENCDLYKIMKKDIGIYQIVFKYIGDKISENSTTSFLIV